MKNILTKLSPKTKAKKLKPATTAGGSSAPAADERYTGLPHTIKSADGLASWELTEVGWSICAEAGGWPLYGSELLEVKVRPDAIAGSSSCCSDSSGHACHVLLTHISPRLLTFPQLANGQKETFAATDIITLKTESITDPALNSQSATVITLPPLTDSCTSNTTLTVVWDSSEKYNNMLYVKCTIPKVSSRISFRSPSDVRRA